MGKCSWICKILLSFTHDVIIKYLIVIFLFVIIFRVINIFEKFIPNNQSNKKEQSDCIKTFEYEDREYGLPKYFDIRKDKLEVESIFYASNTNPKLIIGKYKSNNKERCCGIWLNDDSSFHPNNWFHLPESLKTTEDFEALVKSFKLENLSKN